MFTSKKNIVNIFHGKLVKKNFFLFMDVALGPYFANKQHIKYNDIFIRQFIFVIRVNFLSFDVNLFLEF